MRSLKSCLPTIVLAACALCGCLPLARAQTQPKTFTITGTGSACATIQASNNSVVGITVSGTWVGTFSPTVKIYGAGPSTAKKVTPVDGTAQATITANGGYTAAIGGFTEFDLCPTAWTSGTATVQVYATPAVNIGLLAPNSGPGSGTVSNVATGAGLTGGPITGTGTISLLAALPNGETATTQAALSNDTKVSTDAYADAAVAVETSRATTAEGLKAPLASPALTGTPTAPTQTAGDASTDIATDAFVAAATAAVVNVCGTGGAVAYYAVSGTLVSCDTLALTDGAGNLTATSMTTTSAGASIIRQGQGADNSALCATGQICDQAPTSVTKYTTTRAGAGPSAQGIKLYSALAASKTTESFINFSRFVLNDQANAFTSAGSLDLTLSPPTNGFLLPAPGGSCGSVVAGALCFNGNNYVGTIGGSPNAVTFSSGVTTANTVPKWNSSTLAQFVNSSISDDATTVSTTERINTSVGYRIGNAAASGHYLRGDGTNYVDNTIQAADVTLSAHNLSTPLTCAAASASGTAYTCTTSPSFTPADHDAIIFEPDVASGLLATLNVNSSSAAPIKMVNGVGTVAGTLATGGDCLAVYDGTNWIMQCQTGAVSSYNYAGTTSGTMTMGCNNATCTQWGGSNTMIGLKFNTTGNCSSAASPAVCGTNASGSVALPTGTNPTLQVNTTQVTANSQIFLNVDEGLGTKLSVTCNTTLSTLLNPVVTARSAGSSFTFTIGAVIASNPACVSFTIIN